ncbi:MAG: outer membrane protein assembly factor BamA [Bacteriovoracaceae bacterium]|nr:outer membrane protein assembly factor BamA [Bacteriovoracaceae bacterium]
MKCRGISFLFIFFSFFFFALQVSAIEGNGDLGEEKIYFKVEVIEIKGLRKVEKEAILERIQIKEGMDVTNYNLRSDIKRIYNLKYFDAVEAHHQLVEGKNHLVFEVIERPIVSDILIDGNSGISDSDLKEHIKTKQHNILDEDGLKNDLQKLKKAYEEKGYFLANVNYVLQPDGAEKVKVVFQVEENTKIKVKSILFLGNKGISDLELKAVMKTRENSLLSFMNQAGNYREVDFQEDIERIKYFYRTKGYLQMNLEVPMVTISEDKKWVFLTVKINEGDQYFIEDIIFNGDLLYTNEELIEKMTSKKEKVYSEEFIRQDIQALTEAYQDKGYAFVNVIHNLDIVEGAEKKVNLILTFEKGTLAQFGTITIKGNNRTRDKVIRRELKIHEGMQFSGTELRKSKERVNRLGFFEKESVVFNKISPKDKEGVVDIEVLVQERNTGQLNFGLGYSSVTKAFVQASISQNNFQGKGQNLTLSAQLSKFNQTYNLGFTEPYFLDSKWSLGGDIFKTQNNFSRSLSYQRNGFDVRTGHPIFENTRIFATYKYEDTNLRNIFDPTINPSLENGVASSLTTSLILDKRNNIFEPSKGFYGDVSFEYTGLGGDQRWTRAELEGRYYYSPYGDFVLRSRLLAQQLFESSERAVPRTQKYTMGGPRNMRGYSFEDIGPLIQAPDVNGNLRTFNKGGLASILGTLELEHPLVKEAGIKWVLFFDAGNVYERGLIKGGDYSLRYDYGFGFRWFSPVGILRFEFGYPLAKKDREAGSQFNFDMGQLF